MTDAMSMTWASLTPFRGPERGNHPGRDPGTVCNLGEQASDKVQVEFESTIQDERKIMSCLDPMVLKCQHSSSPSRVSEERKSSRTIIHDSMESNGRRLPYLLATLLFMTRFTITFLPIPLVSTITMLTGVLSLSIPLHLQLWLWRH